MAKTKAKPAASFITDKLVGELIDLQEQAKAIKSRVDSIKDMIKAVSPDEGGLFESKSYIVEVKVNTTERLAGKEDFFNAFGEDKIRAKGLIKEGTSTTVDVKPKGKSKKGDII